MGQAIMTELYISSTSAMQKQSDSLANSINDTLPYKQEVRSSSLRAPTTERHPSFVSFQHLSGEYARFERRAGVSL